MTETLAVTVERDIPFPPEKIWRALTQPHLIEEWLMKNDFAPRVGQFGFEPLLRSGLGRDHHLPNVQGGAAHDRLFVGY